MRVVIVPKTELTAEVRECLASWSRAGLLGPFCLWAVPLGEEAGSAGEVTRIEAGEVGTGTLAEALQGTPSDRVALLGLYAARSEQGFDPSFAAAVERCVATATEVLAFEKGRPIECTVIVAPGRIAQEVPPSVFCGTWNLYVAPEDRGTPAEANQLPHGDGLLPRHAAHALATIADLWSNADVRPTGALSAVAGREAFSIDPPAVRVVRCFSRVIDLGYVSDHIAAGVFRAGRAWPNPDPSHCDRAADPSRLVATATRELFAAHGETLGLTEFKPLVLPPEKRPSLWEALRELLQMIEARIRRLPSDLKDATMGKAHDRLAAFVDRYRDPDAPPTLRWSERPSEERSLSDLGAELQRPLATPDGPTAAAWRDLRQLALGLIDGSTPPESVSAESYEQAGKRLLVTNPEAIVPDPEVPPPGGSPGPVCDPLNLDPRFAADGEAAGKADQETEEESDRSEEWWARLRATLLWRVGVEIAAALEVSREAAAELGEAAEGAAASREEGEAGEEEPKEDVGAAGRRRWRRLRNRLLLSTVLALVASVLAWSNFDLVLAAGAQLLVGAVWWLDLAFVALRFVRGERAIIRAEIAAELEIVNAATRRALHAGDRARLERRYTEYLDWAEMIGWMAHHPWVGEPIGRVEMKEPVPQSSLPAAFRIGAGLVSADRIERLCAQARATVFDSGWLTDLYRASLEESGRRIGLSRSYTGGEGSIDPDADVLEDPDSPRRQLRDAIRRGDGRHLRDNELTGTVLRFVDGLPLDAAADEVSSSLALRADGDVARESLPPCPAWFAPPPDLQELAPRILGAVAKVSASTSSGPRVGLGVAVEFAGGIVTSHRVVEGATSVRVQLAAGPTVEATVARLAPDRDLALLELDGQPDSVEGVARLSERAPRPGDPVLAPSPPDRDPDQPEVALGLITAGVAGANGSEGQELGATYRTAAGPAGAPVFDLGGNLVGIHRGRRAAVSGSSGAGTVHEMAAVADVEALLEADQPTDERGGSPVENGSARLDRVGEKPVEFLGALFVRDPDPMGFLPHHWVDADEEHMPEMTLGGDDFEYAPLNTIATSLGFLEPVRAIVHRVDIAAPVNARELTSCKVDPG